MAATRRSSPSTSARPRSGCAGSSSASGRTGRRSSTATPTSPVPTAAGTCAGTGPRLVAEMDEGPGGRARAGAGRVDRRRHVGRRLRAARRARRAGRAPVSYRDHRTDGYRRVVDRIGVPQRCHATTGVQLQPFNTIFQLAAHDRGRAGPGPALLLLPELLVHHLTGEVVGERTQRRHDAAWSTSRRGTGRRSWPTPIGLEPVVLPADPRGRAPRRARWHGVPVHLVGGHDTASAVVGHGATAGARHRVRVGRHVAARRPRAGGARRSSDAGPAGELHQRDRRARRRARS